MTKLGTSAGLLIPLLFAGGCAGETRFLSLNPRPTSTERKAYEIHDPFPDESAGPETFSRPRGFINPRTDERREFELRTIRSAAAPTSAPYNYAGPPAYDPGRRSTANLTIPRSEVEGRTVQGGPPGAFQ